MSTAGFTGAAGPAQPQPDPGPRELAAQVRALRRWVTALLVLVTFLAGGVLGGAAMWWHQARQPGGGPLGLARAVQVLGNPEERHAFRSALADGRRAARPQVRDLQAARASLAALLAEPTVTADALQDGLARLRQAEGVLRERLEPGAAEALANFPLQRRRAIADAIAPQGRRGKVVEE